MIWRIQEDGTVLTGDDAGQYQPRRILVGLVAKVGDVHGALGSLGPLAMGKKVSICDMNAVLRFMTQQEYPQKRKVT